MRKILFIAIVLLLPAFSFGQFAIGPRAGISMSRLQVDELLDNNGQPLRYTSEGNRVGFHVGAFTRIRIASFYIQPEVLFTSAGGKIQLDSDLTGREISNLKYNKLDIPVMLGLVAGNFFRVQAGPVFSLLLSDDARDIGVVSETRQNFNNATWGYQAGIGFDIVDKLYIDFKYEGNLSRFGNSINIGNQQFDTDMRSSLFMVMLGFNIL